MHNPAPVLENNILLWVRHTRGSPDLGQKPVLIIINKKKKKRRELAKYLTLLSWLTTE